MKEIKKQIKNAYNLDQQIKALKLMEKYLKENPKDEEILLLKAQILEDSNLWGYLDEETKKIDPLQLINDIIKINPKYALAWNEKGNILSENPRTILKALVCYKKALELAPKEYIILFNMARCFQERNEHKKAINLFNSYIKHKPKNEEAFFYKAISHAYLKEKKQMIKSLKKSFKLDDGDLMQLQACQHPLLRSFLSDPITPSL